MSISEEDHRKSWESIGNLLDCLDPFGFSSIKIFMTIMNPHHTFENHINRDQYKYIVSFIETKSTYLLEWAFNWINKEKLCKYMENYFVVGFIAWALYTNNDEIITYCLKNTNYSNDDVYKYVYSKTGDKYLHLFREIPNINITKFTDIIMISKSHYL